MTFEDIVSAIQGGVGTLGGDLWGGLQSLGGILNPDNPLAGLFQIAGMVGQGFTDEQMMQWANEVQGRQKTASDVAGDPAQMMAKVLGYEQPLDANLKANVANFVNPQLAARGMATSPGQTDYAMAQAIAPFVQENQARAAQLAEFGQTQPFKMQPFQYPTFQTSGVASTPGGGGTTAPSSGFNPTDPTTWFDPNQPLAWANPSSTGFDPLSWLSSL